MDGWIHWVGIGNLGRAMVPIRVSLKYFDSDSVRIFFQHLAPKAFKNSGKSPTTQPCNHIFLDDSAEFETRFGGVVQSLLSSSREEQDSK